MYTQYGNITLSTGAHEGGICSIKIAPRQWIGSDISIDFLTNTVNAALDFSGSPLPNNDIIALELVPDSFFHNEKPVNSKTGNYFDVSIGGSVNNMTPFLKMIIDSLRYDELVALVIDHSGKTRLVGNRETGLSMQVNYTNTNKDGGMLECSIELSMQIEKSSPYYL